jgi:hypothetical protein
MKKTAAILIVFLTFAFSLAAQENASSVPVSRQLHSFSPMAQIYLKYLGLADRNSNGVIDKDKGEGYEAFTAQYGNADVGFHANGVVLGAANGKLEEPEIINHYYISIRFKPDFQQETAAIEGEVKAYVYANNIPLVWLDDQQGTVMNAVNAILGEGWNEQEVTEDEAVALFNRVKNRLAIRGLTGDPAKTGYYTLPEFITNKAAYCFEAANFAFWFFSELKVNSMYITADLTRTTSHGANQLCNSGKIVDYFGTSSKYKNIMWETKSLFNLLSDYYSALSQKDKLTADYQKLREEAAIVNKYDMNDLSILVDIYNKEGLYREISEIGDFVFEQINLDDVMATKRLNANSKNNARYNVMLFAKSYSLTNNKEGFEKAKSFLNKYYGKDKQVKEYLKFYALGGY